MESPEAVRALERTSAREGYRPLRYAAGLTQTLLQYPGIEGLLAEALGLVSEGGAAVAEWNEVLMALQHELAAAHTEGDQAHGDPSTLQLLRDLALRAYEAADRGDEASEHRSERWPFSDGLPRFLAKRDARGLATVRPQAGPHGDAVVPDPFVDENLDGRPDVSDGGRFKVANGAELTIPAPFKVPGERQPVERDRFGRLLRAPSADETSDEDRLVYEYIDVSRTLLSGVLLEVHAVLQERPSTTVDLAAPTVHLLGPAARSMHRYDNGTVLEFDGFDTTQSPLLDVAHLLGALVDQGVARDFLELVDRLATDHPSAIARTVQVVRRATDWLDDDIEVREDNSLSAHMHDWLTQLARPPGLLEDVLAALRDPATRVLGPLFSQLMTHTDYIDYDQDDPNAPPIGAPQTPVDRSRPDLRDNRSIFQRVAHLMYDTDC